MNFAKREPVVLANLVLTALVAVLGVLVAFEVWDPTPAQVGALTGLYTAAAAVVIYVVRGQVYSPSTVEKLTADAERETLGE